MKRFQDAFPALMGGIFIFSAFLWHWLGPIDGKFSLFESVNIMRQQISLQSLAAPLMLILTIAAALQFQSIQAWRQKPFAWEAVPLALFVTVGSGVGFGISWISIFLTVLLVAGYSNLNKSVPAYAIFISGYALTSYAFTILKMSIFINAVHYDALILSFEKAVGLDPIRLSLIGFVQSNQELMALVDICYLLLFPFTMVFAISAYILGLSIWKKYIFSIFSVYACGALIYFLIPAFGPFMFESFHQVFPAWSEVKPDVFYIQTGIIKNTQQILEGDYSFSYIPPFAFVAAMPSLHAASPAVALFILRKTPGAIRAICVTMLLISCWSAIVSGMHYMTDILVGIALGYISVRLAEILVDTKDAPSTVFLRDKQENL